MTVGHFWIRRPRPPTRSARGRAAWPGSPIRSRRTTRKCARSCNRDPASHRRFRELLESGQADAAGVAGEPHHAGSDPGHLQPVARTTSGVAARGRRGRSRRFGLPKNNPTGCPQGDFTLTITDPHSCTVGFLPPSQWRSPADTTTIDTPDGLYCKLPQDSPIAVRGARNYPCMAHPGKRAPTVELCNDPKGYQPLAMRQHSLGPYPIDPNLIAQGIPPDDRVDFSDRLYAPVEGTPLPPGAIPAGTPPDPLPPGAPPPPVQAPLPPPGTRSTGTFPRRGSDSRRRRWSLRRCRGPPPGSRRRGSATVAGGARRAKCLRRQGFWRTVSRHAQYDPLTGSYLTPDGQLQQLTNAAGRTAPKSWKDLLPI